MLKFTRRNNAGPIIKIVRICLKFAGQDKSDCLILSSLTGIQMQIFLFLIFLYGDNKMNSFLLKSSLTNDSNSNNNKKSSRKKLVRVASQQKEVSGEEYLQLLLEEREVEMKKSMGKYREGTEAQPETSSHKSVELIEDQSSFRKTKSSSKKFLESDDEGESKQGPLDQQKHVSEETQRQDSFGGEERNNSQEKKSMGKNEEMTNSQRNKSQNKDEVVSGTKTSEIKKNEEENRRKSDEMRLEEEKKEDDSIEQIIRTEEKDSKEQKTNINDENYLDTSKFGLSKKKSKEKEELHSVEKEKELERKALEMQGLEKPSLTNFIEQATRDYEMNQGIGLETSNVKKSTLLHFLEKSAHDQEKSPANAENNEETKTSEIKMKLEPQANEEVPQANEEVPQANEEVKEIHEIENPPISHQLEDDKGKEDTSKKSKSSGKSSKSKSKNQSKSKSKSPEKKENGDIEIIITLDSGDEENKETLETNPVQNPSEELKPKSPQRRRKSSLKPSSYNKDQDVKPVGENKSTKKSAVKFAEMLEISENKNPIIIEDSPKNERITRSKEREMIANEKIEKEEKEEKEEKHQSKSRKMTESKRNRKKKTSLKHKKGLVSYYFQILYTCNFTI